MENDVNIKSPYISVIVPVFNVEKYITECIESIIHQSLKELEIILVDDGSSDNTGQILDSYANLDERIMVIHKENQGVSAARNDGIKASTAPYLYIMDSDDYLELDALEYLYQVAVKENVDIVMADHRTFTEDFEYKTHHFFSEEFVTNDKTILEAIQKMILHFNYSPYKVLGDSALGIAPPWTRLVKSSLIKDNNLAFDSYVKGIFDDGLFAIEEMEFCSSLAYTQKIIYNYRLLASSLIHKYNPKRVEIHERIYEKLDQFAKKYHKNRSFYEAIYCRTIMNFVNLMDTYYLNNANPDNLISKIKQIKKCAEKPENKTAFKYVDVNYLTKTQYAVTRLVRLKAYLLIPLLFSIRKKLS